MSSVLERFLEQASTDDYGRSIPRPPGTPGDRVRGAMLVIVAALVGALIVVTAAFTLWASTQEREQTREALVSRIITLQGSVDDWQSRAQDLAARVDTLREQIDAGGGEDDRTIDDLSAGAGITEMTGPGVLVTVDDAAGAEPDSLNRVLDRDLQDVVNALWAMGAEGVSINDQRLTSASAIRGAGEAILVNYRPLERPYAVSAVGVSVPAGSPLQQLLESLSTDYGLIFRIDERDVTLPAGILQYPGSAAAVEGQPQ
jgi:uncharacterized protein YlxW (UPF0749 family)